VTIAERFTSALAEVTDPALAGPELLPVRLARACARTLSVADASLSLVDASQMRIPLGASSDPSELAERLQFTVGSGPCITAQELRQPVFAVEEDLRRRWPVFTELLFGATPFRAIVALPLQPALAGPGAIDLYFRRSAEVLALDVFEAVAVGELVTSALSDATVWSEWTPSDGPEWLHGAVPERRAAVWEAMGKVSVELEVSTPEALELLRAQAYGRGLTADDVAEELLAGELSAAELEDGAAEAG
jgi:hypothetical protein